MSKDKDKALSNVELSALMEILSQDELPIDPRCHSSIKKFIESLQSTIDALAAERDALAVQVEECRNKACNVIGTRTLLIGSKPVSDNGPFRTTTIEYTKGSGELLPVNCPKCHAAPGGCDFCNGSGVADMPAIYAMPEYCPVCGMPIDNTDSIRTKYRCRTELGRAWQTEGIIDIWAGECIHAAYLAALKLEHSQQTILATIDSLKAELNEPTES